MVSATDMTVGTGNAKIDCGVVEKCFDYKVSGGGFVIVNGAKISAW
jgi:hypothetical protein